MKFIREYWIYVLVILLLLLAIFWSIFKTNKKNTDIKNNQNTENGQSAQVLKNTEIIKSDGTTVEVKNIYGQVLDWNSQTGILKVKISESDIREFEINPTVTKVMVPPSRNKGTSSQFYVFKKASGKHWETAFCQGDMASIQINNSGKIELALNDGRRMCGYLGVWE